VPPCDSSTGNPPSHELLVLGFVDAGTEAAEHAEGHHLGCESSDLGILPAPKAVAARGYGMWRSFEEE